MKVTVRSSSVAWFLMTMYSFKKVSLQPLSGETERGYKPTLGACGSIICKYYFTSLFSNLKKTSYWLLFQNLSHFLTSISRPDFFFLYNVILQDMSISSTVSAMTFQTLDLE